MKILSIPTTNEVLCDICSDDYTNSNEHGGFLFDSYAVCPKCAPETEKNIIDYKEAKFIKARCPNHLSFRDWVYTLRQRSHDNANKTDVERERSSKLRDVSE